MNASTPADVVVLTGFLGSGKTTLLNRILTAPTRRRIAVIVNEFGEVGIDHDLLIVGGQHVIEMSNGCICCSVNGDLLRGLLELSSRRGAFDTLVIETTGLADPVPVVRSLGADAALREIYRFRGVVTLADAKHVVSQIAAHSEARAQIAFADLVLLNKIDLVATDALDGVESDLRRFNAHAPIQRTRDAETDIAALLALAPISLTPTPDPFPQGGGEDANVIAEQTQDAPSCDNETLPQWQRALLPLAGSGRGWGSSCENEKDHAHHHHNHMQTVCISAPGALDGLRLGAWLQTLDKGDTEILRIKGILHIWGDPDQFWFQGVRRDYDCRPGRRWGDDEARLNRLVFIGKNLDETTLREGFRRCITTTVEPSQRTSDRFGRWHEEISAQRLDQIRFWMRQNFGFPPRIPILVKEVPCAKPGCPPIETAIVALMDDAPPRLFKVQASINDLTFDQVYDLMDNPMPCC